MGSAGIDRHKRMRMGNQRASVVEWYPSGEIMVDLAEMLDERAWPRLQKISRAAVNSRTAEYRVSWAMFALCLTVAQLCTIKALSCIADPRLAIPTPPTASLFEVNSL
jgi:hypothetical protein